MKSLSSLCLVALVALLALTGCRSGTAGGPGVSKDPDQQPLVGQANDTFQLERTAAAIKQGETRSFSIVIKRATNFGEDVTLAFSDLPSGLSMDDSTPTIAHGDSEARFTLTAAGDAALGEFSISVTGHPTNGSDATNKLDITVTKN